MKKKGQAEVLDLGLPAFWAMTRAIGDDDGSVRDQLKGG